MFTIDQIKNAHSKIKSGADFPTYVQELVKLGVIRYDTFVSDGHSEYFGRNDYSIQSDVKYKVLEVAENSSRERFKERLKNHQQGQTDFATFCRDSAEAGVERWSVDMVQMTCTYYDKYGNNMVVEEIPVL